MTNIYRCDWKRSDACLGETDDRTKVMSVTVGNDQQTVTHCCYACLPEWVPTPNHAD